MAAAVLTDAEALGAAVVDRVPLRGGVTCLVVADRVAVAVRRVPGESVIPRRVRVLRLRAGPFVTRVRTFLDVRVAVGLPRRLGRAGDER